MTWHVETVTAAEFPTSLESLRRTGATITSCRPCPEGYRVVYVIAAP